MKMEPPKPSLHDGREHGLEMLGPIAWSLRLKPAQKTVPGINLKVSVRAQNPACLKPLLPLLFSYHAPVSLVLSLNQLEEKCGAGYLLCCFLFFSPQDHTIESILIPSGRSKHFLKTLPFFT